MIECQYEDYDEVFGHICALDLLKFRLGKLQSSKPFCVSIRVLYTDITHNVFYRGGS